MCLSHAQSRVLVAVLSFTLATPLQNLAADARHNRSQNYPSGLTWVMQAMAALTGGSPVSSVSLSGSVAWTIGNNQGNGTITLQSSANTNSHIQLSTSAGNRSETRTWASSGSGPVGQWTDLNGQPHQMVQHNCWTDAVWFFPALSMLSDYADPTMVYNDLGQEQYNGDSVEHIQAYRSIPGLPADVEDEVQRISTVNYYLDSQTAIPVAMTFATHGDTDVNRNIPIVLVFSQYQAVDGIQIPFQVARMFSGSPLYQITISSVNLNGQDSPVHRP
jgi:hypothetical protein